MKRMRSIRKLPEQLLGKLLATLPARQWHIFSLTALADSWQQWCFTLWPGLGIDQLTLAGCPAGSALPGYQPQAELSRWLTSPYYLAAPTPTKDDGGKTQPKGGKKEGPIDDDAIEAIQAFTAAIANISRYPTTSDVVRNSVDRVAQFLESYLKKKIKLTFSEVENKVLIDDKMMGERDQKKAFIISFLSLLAERQVRSITFNRGLTFDELKEFLEIMAQGIDQTGRPKDQPLMMGEYLKERKLKHIAVDDKIFIEMSNIAKIADLEALLNDQNLSLLDVPPEVFSKYLIGKFDLELDEAMEDRLIEAQGNPVETAQIIQEGVGVNDENEVFNIHDQRIDRVMNSIKNLTDSALSFDKPEVQEKLVEEMTQLVSAFKSNLLAEVMIREKGGEDAPVDMRDKIFETISEQQKVGVLDHVVDEFKHIKMDQTATADDKLARMEDFLGLVNDMFEEDKGVLLPDDTLEALQQATLIMGNITKQDFDREKLERPRVEFVNNVTELIDGTQGIVSENGDVRDLGDMVTKLVTIKKTELIEEFPEMIQQNLSRDASDETRQKAVESIGNFTTKLVEHNMDSTFQNMVGVLSTSMENEASGDVFSAIVSTLENAAEKLLVENKYNAATQIIEMFNKYRDMKSNSSGLDTSSKAMEAVSGLGENKQIMELLTNVFRNADGDLQKSISKTLITFREPAVPLLLDLLSESETMRVRRAALETVVKIGEYAIQPIIRKIEGPDEQPWYIKRNLITVLGRIGSRSAGDALARFMTDPEPRVRREAIRAVAQCGCNNEEQIYLAAIKDADEAVSRFGIAQLGNIGSKSALTELWNMLKIDFVGSFKDVEAQEACKAIGKIGDKASIPILTNLITNKKIILLSKFKKFDYLGLKLKAIWALGIIGDESTRSLLKKLFEDKDPKIKREAELALQKLDEKKMGLVDESSGRRKKKDVDPDSLSDKKITFDMFEEEDGEGKGHGKRDEDQVKTRIARRDEE